MGTYYHSDPAPSEIRILDDTLYAEWVATNNPKAAWWTLIPDQPGPDYYWDGSAWVQYPPYVPQEISRLQGHLVLERHNLLAQCETLVAQGSTETQIAWRNATTFNRQSPTLLSLATALGLSDTELDQLFIEGSQIIV